MKTPERVGKTKRRWLRDVPLMLGMLFCAAPAIAQFSTSTIRGSVSTDDGRPISNAHIRWLQDGLSISVDTDSMGQFSYLLADPGSHTLSFEHSSTAAVGLFEATTVPGSSIFLTAVLQYGTEDGSNKDKWDI